MTNKISNEILENYYINAVQSYRRCIEKRENSFLSDEIGVAVYDIEPERNSVRFKYLDTNTNIYHIEVKLNLLSNKFNLGYYISVLDEEHKEIDNYLVFN